MSTDHISDETIPDASHCRTTNDDEVEALRERVAELEAEKERQDALITGALERIRELEERLEADESAPKTELDVALEAPPDVVTDQYNIAEQRALIVAEHLRDIGGPNGAKVDQKLVRIVEREREESLAWSQIYRACEALESMTRGEIEFIDDDGGDNRLHVNDDSLLP
jgi:predicted nuclease with TOPRIM domain